MTPTFDSRSSVFDPQTITVDGRMPKDVADHLIGIMEQAGKRHWFNVICRISSDLIPAVMLHLRNDIQPRSRP